MARVHAPPPEASEFGRRVRQRRLKAGLSQIELAERAGLHFTFVSSIERGKRNPTLTTILSIAVGLGIDPATLIRGMQRADR